MIADLAGFKGFEWWPVSGCSLPKPTPRVIVCGEQTAPVREEVEPLLKQMVTLDRKKDFWAGRQLAYLSGKGQLRYVAVVGWKDLRRRHIILRPVDLQIGDEKILREIITRRVTAKQRWLVLPEISE